MRSERELGKTSWICSFNDAFAWTRFISQLGFKAALGVHYMGHMGRLGFESGRPLLLASMEVIQL